MALVINTNISSLGAQRQLNGSGMTLDRATERLSSGLRVNSAKDDAAGLAIATRMTSQVRGLDQAVRNANDGVSLIQTAEGALQESTNILQRMRELAVQSSNGIYTDSDRKTLDAENKQLIAELDRIAKTTSFNGKNLLDGSLGKVDLQVGASAGQTITFDIKQMDSKSLGLGSTTSDLSGDDVAAYSKSTFSMGTAATFNFSTTAGTVKITVGDKSEILDLSMSVTSAATLASAITGGGTNAAKLANLGVTVDSSTAQMTALSGKTITLSNSTAGFATASGLATSTLGGVSSTDGVYASVAQGSIVVNGSAISGFNNLGGSGATDSSLKNVMNDINSKVSGVTASGYNIVSATTSGTGLLAGTQNLRLTLGSVDGGAPVNYDISNTANMDELVTKINDTTGGKIVAAKDANGKLTLSNTTGGDIKTMMSTVAAPTVATVGASLGTITGIAEIGSTGTANFKGNIALKSNDGSAITITKGANGTDAELAMLGFRVTEGAGKVLGGSLGSVGQNAALANNDLKINGVDIGVIAQDAGLTAKITKINSLSDTTGVTASAAATQSFKTDSLATTAQVAGSASKAITYAGTVKINGVDVSFAKDDTTAQQATAINNKQTSTGVTASIDSDGRLNLYSESAITIVDNKSSSFIADNGLDTPMTTTGVGSAAVSSNFAVKMGTVAPGVAYDAPKTFNGGTAGYKVATAAGTALTINTIQMSSAIAIGDTIQQVKDKINLDSAASFVEASISDTGQLVLTATNTTASITIAGADAAALTGAAFDVDAVALTGSVDVKINGTTIAGLTDALALSATGADNDLLDKINAQTAKTGVTAALGTNGELIFRSEVGGAVNITGSASTAFIAQYGVGTATTDTVKTYTLTESAQVAAKIQINGTDVDLTNLQNKDTIVKDLNAKSANTGVTAAIDENGQLKLSSASTITLKASGASGFEAATALGVKFNADTIGGTDGVNDTLVIDPRLNLKSANSTPISVEVSAAGAAATGLLNQNTSLAGTVTGSAISNLSIATKAGATAALTSIDTALGTINDTRSQLGSINNRLDFTVANLSSISEKTTAARSRIIDADFAQETANLSRSTVLQQAATAMLAQANQRPQNVLSLLR
jgi:flagellin